MIQRDVADRLLAEPGSRTYSSLTVLHRLCVTLCRARDLAPGLFFPVPNVRSSFVRATPRADAPIGADELAQVETVVRAAFGQRRKTLANALRGAGLPEPAAACCRGRNRPARARRDPRAGGVSRAGARVRARRPSAESSEPLTSRKSRPYTSGSGSEGNRKSRSSSHEPKPPILSAERQEDRRHA